MASEKDLGKNVLKKLRTLKPNECAVVYDGDRGLLIGACNKDGELQIKTRKVEELSRASEK